MLLFPCALTAVIMGQGTSPLSPAGRDPSPGGHPDSRRPGRAAIERKIPMSQSTVPDTPECLTDSSFWDENKQSFLDWLRERHNYTPLTIKLLCKQTGGDYNKVMRWYRQRYRYENDRKQYLINTNPFLKMEENKNG